MSIMDGLIMQHKCTACGKLYARGSEEIINGCSCGNKLFYFISEKKKRQASGEVSYFYELEDDENEEIIAFDLEAINIKEHGRYEIDINALMSNDDSLVYRYGEGKYSIDIMTDPSKIRQKKY